MEEVLYLSMLFVALSLVITIFALSRQRSDDGSVKLPPGSFGWPIMGETIEFLFGKPEKFIGDRMKKYSPDIFKTNILGEKTAVICGPNGNKFLFSNENTLFTISQPHPMDKLFGSYKAANTTLSPPPGANTTPSPPLVKGADEVKLIRAPGFFKPEALMRYLPHMDLITQQQLHIHWEGKGYSTDHPLVDMKPPQLVEVFPLSKTVTLMMACRLFLGIDNPERIAIFVRHLDDITLGLHSIVLNFPGTIFYRANKAAIAIRKELVTVIKEKKAAMACTSIGEEPMQYLDILSHMIIATDTTGKYMPEAEIADKMMGLIIAGYSTVATTITFFMKYVGECPHIYNKVLSEQLEISRTKNPGEFLDWNDLSKMKYSWNVMCEVMRLVPPLQGTFREVLCDFTYAGYNIPKGWKVYWTVSTTNKNPQYFRDPEIFNPSRYEEGEARIPYTYMPFGGGPRLCPGNEYARLAVLTFIHNVVKRFKWEVVNPNEKVLGAMMPTPEKGLPIRLYCH